MIKGLLLLAGFALAQVSCSSDDGFASAFADAAAQSIELRSSNHVATLFNGTDRSVQAWVCARLPEVPGDSRETLVTDGPWTVPGQCVLSVALGRYPEFARMTDETLSRSWPPDAHEEVWWAVLAPDALPSASVEWGHVGAGRMDFSDDGRASTLINTASVDMCNGVPRLARTENAPAFSPGEGVPVTRSGVPAKPRFECFTSAPDETAWDAATVVWIDRTPVTMR